MKKREEDKKTAQRAKEISAITEAVALANKSFFQQIGAQMPEGATMRKRSASDAFEDESSFTPRKKTNNNMSPSRPSPRSLIKDLSEKIDNMTKAPTPVSAPATPASSVASSNLTTPSDFADLRRSLTRDIRAELRSALSTPASIMGMERDLSHDVQTRGDGLMQQTTDNYKEMWDNCMSPHTNSLILRTPSPVQMQGRKLRDSNSYKSSEDFFRFEQHLRQRAEDTTRLGNKEQLLHQQLLEAQLKNERNSLLEKQLFDKERELVSASERQERLQRHLADREREIMEINKREEILRQQLSKGTARGQHADSEREYTLERQLADRDREIADALMRESELRKQLNETDRTPPEQQLSSGILRAQRADSAREYTLKQHLLDRDRQISDALMRESELRTQLNAVDVSEVQALRSQLQIANNLNREAKDRTSPGMLVDIGTSQAAELHEQIMDPFHRAQGGNFVSDTQLHALAEDQQNDSDWPHHRDNVDTSSYAQDSRFHVENAALNNNVSTSGDTNAGRRLTFSPVVTEIASPSPLEEKDAGDSINPLPQRPPRASALRRSPHSPCAMSPQTNEPTVTAETNPQSITINSSSSESDNEEGETPLDARVQAAVDQATRIARARTIYVEKLRDRTEGNRRKWNRELIKTECAKHGVKYLAKHIEKTAQNLAHAVNM
jgi:hypothetical protein